MCGIIACLIKPTSNVLVNDILIHGLTQLQNRGYDSAGISLLTDRAIITTKFASDYVNNAIIKLSANIEAHNNTRVGIAHTRWATHGAKSDINSHPHHSNDNKISIVHNGIIENYIELKNFLINSGYIFHSQTDSEVIANLISFYYNKTNNMENAIKKTIRRLQGTYGIAVLCLDTTDKLYCVANGSPLLLGKNDDSIIIASEIAGFCNSCKSYITLNHDDILTVSLNTGSLCYKTDSIYEMADIIIEDYDLTPSPYLHWTMKEIFEQPIVIQKSINFGGRILNTCNVKLGGLDKCNDILKKIDHLIVIGCGTSEHAGIYASHVFKQICNFTTVHVYNGAEFSLEDLPKKGITGIIFISQSGETKDVFRCVELIKGKNIIKIGVINTVDSLIARHMDCGIYCNAGREVAVASTKSFTSQVICLYLLAIWFSSLHNVCQIERKQIISDLIKLPNDFENTLTNLNAYMQELAKEFIETESFFILGKGTDEPIAKEGALKIKEISYIHAEGHSATALKHGPFALLSHDMPVILIDNIQYSKKIQNTLEEISSRHSPIYFITTSDNYNNTESNKIKANICVEKNITFQSLLNNIPLQLIAYHVSVQKNINPDTPKNLAKVVTVE